MLEDRSSSSAARVVRPRHSHRKVKVRSSVHHVGGIRMLDDRSSAACVVPFRMIKVQRWNLMKETKKMKMVRGPLIVTTVCTTVTLLCRPLSHSTTSILPALQPQNLKRLPGELRPQAILTASSPFTSVLDSSRFPPLSLAFAVRYGSRHLPRMRRAIQHTLQDFLRNL